MNRLTKWRYMAAALIASTFLLTACAKGPSDQEALKVLSNRRGSYLLSTVYLSSRIVRHEKPRKLSGQWVFPFTVEYRYIAEGLNTSGYCDDTERQDVEQVLLQKDNFDRWGVLDSRLISEEQVNTHSRPASVPMEVFYADRLARQNERKGRSGLPSASDVRGSESAPSAMQVPASASQDVRAAAHICQIAVEAYATDHCGEYPASDDKWRSIVPAYFPGGDVSAEGGPKPGQLPVNPYTGQKYVYGEDLFCEASDFTPERIPLVRASDAGCPYLSLKALSMKAGTIRILAFGQPATQYAMVVYGSTTGIPQHDGVAGDRSSWTFFVLHN